MENVGKVTRVQRLVKNCTKLFQKQYQPGKPCPVRATARCTLAAMLVKSRAASNLQGCMLQVLQRVQARAQRNLATVLAAETAEPLPAARVT